MEFLTILKRINTEGNLVYEYNPLRNFRLSESKYIYLNSILSFKEFVNLTKIQELDLSGIPYLQEEIDGNYLIVYYLNEFYKVVGTGSDLKKIVAKDWNLTRINNIWTNSLFNNDPILLESGSIVDLNTDLLNFNILNPIDIIPQYSYDGSVNLILNQKDNPIIINTRFSPLGRNKYKIVDRKGENDTNIYDEEYFKSLTSLYKNFSTLAKFNLLDVNFGGNLKVGNYHIYLKYLDDDENETDFFCESGLISIFIGNRASNIETGEGDENSHKLIRFSIHNLDNNFKKIRIYFSRSTSNLHQSATRLCYRVNQAINIESNVFTLTGFELNEIISENDLNLRLLKYNNTQTLLICLNKLFLANVNNVNVNYNDLSYVSLYFCPKICLKPFNNFPDLTYLNYDITLSYYNSKFIYNYTGYWHDEIYRLGVVYIYSDYTKSPVFNTRGIKNLKDDTIYTQYDFTERPSIDYNQNFLINNETLENTKGVIHISRDYYKTDLILGIKFDVDDSVLKYLKSIGIIGILFVRQRRIPTTLCLMFTLGVHSKQRFPLLYTNTEYVIDALTGPMTDSVQNNALPDRFKIGLSEDEVKDYESDIKSIRDTINDPTNSYDDPIFINGPLTVNSEWRQVVVNDDNVEISGAICPEYDIDYPYYNNLFTGTDFTVVRTNNFLCDMNKIQKYLYLTTDVDEENIVEEKEVKIIGLEDNVKLVEVDCKKFRGRSGEFSTVLDMLDIENTSTLLTRDVRYIRGIFGPYLGIVGLNKLDVSKTFDIKIPGYSIYNLVDYFKIRYEDKDPYYPISDLLDLDEIDGKQFFRGDCYFCRFTHRLIRNFNDPTSPTNDLIVDPECLSKFYLKNEDTVIAKWLPKINTGDLNAVNIGMWVSVLVKSTYNLNIRTLDKSYTDEISLFGNPRGFYPRHPMSDYGAYKLPEALCYNKGFGTSLSATKNMLIEDVPAFNTNYSTRIAYSNNYITSSILNGLRVFPGQNYRDYPLSYGSITKIIELDNDLICIFEHGIGLLTVKERSMATEGTGGPVYINTKNVLPENPVMISDTFGSQWSESVIKTSKFIYGVDTVGKKIWRCTKNNFEIISDYKVLKFLNDNISLTERELEPIIGVRNVKTHYNKYKNDVMFTFYDDLYGFEEEVWNLCWNETLGIWTTFYSWVPSYSENINNQFFSFDRNTSKYISKLAIGTNENFGITLSTSEIPTSYELDNGKYYLGKVYLTTQLNYYTLFELVQDRFNLNKDFRLSDKIYFGNDILLNPESNIEEYLNQKEPCYLKLYITISSSEFNEKYNSEFYERDSNGNIVKENGLRIWLEPEDLKNPDKIVLYLNIKANLKKIVDDKYGNISSKYSIYDAGYYESSVAIIPQYNKQFLTTDFWKHGLAGIIDISDKLYPTYWYGKQHPFEFEFVVRDKIDKHKIFDNLEIISNNAEPESFHYEIVGDSYEFAKDKLNMYIRLEATKHLYLNSGSDITYDHNYNELHSEHRPYKVINGIPDYTYFDKSTLFPLYYSRLDSINDIEDKYHQMTSDSNTDYSALSGAEIIKDGQEYKIWNHCKAVDIREHGRMRGNMIYNEDKWYVLINPLNFILNNEDSWDSLSIDGSPTGNKNNVPVEIKQCPIPEDIGNTLIIPEEFNDATKGRAIIAWDDTENLEAKIKDKYIKIRIRYSGKKLAVISAIKTFYSISST